MTKEMDVRNGRRTPNAGTPTAAVRMSSRASTMEAFLDAAEQLLIRVGHAGVTTRALAAEAGANHGLVHYYFGSMEDLMVRVLERFTDRLIERQRALYAADTPFIEKWRTAMRHMDTDLESGYQKVWLELQALAWNRPDLRKRVARVTHRWRKVLTEAFTKAMQEYGIDSSRFPVEAMVALVATFNQGMILERHVSIVDGHRELLEVIDRWLQVKEEGKAR